MDRVLPAAAYIIAILNIAHQGSKNPKMTLLILMIVGAIDVVCLLAWVLFFGDRHLETEQ